MKGIEPYKAINFTPSTPDTLTRAGYFCVIRLDKYFWKMNIKIIVSILAVFIGQHLMADNIQSIDPSEIPYTTPSIPNELPPLSEFGGNKDTKIFPIHEDDWSQIEFINHTQLNEMQNVMVEYSAFEEKNRRKVGWQNVYVRRFPHAPLFKGLNAKKKLFTILSAPEGPPPIVHSFSEINGLVTNGFTIVLGKDVTLYGYTKGMNLQALGASLGENPDNQSLVAAFALLNKKYGLVLVDWRSQFILTGVDSAGQIQIW
ncbi:MAG: hypothetical protein ACH254_21550, partial [Candidatus Thiodiazotropha endolucinida]